VEGDNEEAGKEKVVERRRDLRTTEVTAVDGGIEEDVSCNIKYLHILVYF
jgi:hypothetical protein